MPRKGAGTPDMTVREAGRKGGQTTAKRDTEFYSKIGRKGGQRVKELVERGKRTIEVTDK